jgi:hypothetical protein
VVAPREEDRRGALDDFARSSIVQETDARISAGGFLYVLPYPVHGCTLRESEVHANDVLGHGF